MNQKFELVTDYQPRGDQPNAIIELTEGLNSGLKFQTLLGATGTGKTFTIANVIEKTNRPTLVMAPNKTLAAQLYSEFKDLFPKNAVEYFVSYYDYYQPEAYIPSTDTFIEKDSAINDAIDRMRHSATRSLLDRNDVIIVASVSCIYGLGSSEAYYGMLLHLEQGQAHRRKDLLAKLIEIQYQRNDHDFFRGKFRVRGDVVEIFPPYEEDEAIRIEFFGDEIEAIWRIDPFRGKRLEKLDKVAIYPNSHYVIPPERKRSALDSIKAELKEVLAEMISQGRLLEAQRLEQRTQFDIEMIVTAGFCNGIENYSRHMSGRQAGQPPPCLLDYLPQNFLLVADESHVTVPQIGGMYRGDRSRKSTLIEHGFRLPSALDNRPLKFDEWEEKLHQIIYVSATPGDFELERSQGVITEQIIRPTGLIDPEVEIRPALEQVDDVYGEVRKRIDAGERVLVTTLTKRMSEDLTDYLRELGVKVRYLHSDIDTIERMNIIRDLRRGVFDVLVGINLLREGLDIPEVSLVAILDADKEGFLRSTRSLIQTIGRAARNSSGKVILYADKRTKSIDEAVSETNRRREIQIAHNLKHGITPQTIIKKIADIEQHVPVAEGDEGKGEDSSKRSRGSGGKKQDISAKDNVEQLNSVERIEARIAELRTEMKEAAADLRFEDAANCRDRMRVLESRLLGVA